MNWLAIIIHNKPVVCILFCKNVVEIKMWREKSKNCGDEETLGNQNNFNFIYKYDSTYMSKVDLWPLRSFLLIEQFPGPSS